MDEGKGNRNVVEKREKKGCDVANLCDVGKGPRLGQEGDKRDETRCRRYQVCGNPISTSAMRGRGFALLQLQEVSCPVEAGGGGLIAGGNANSLRLESDAAPAPFAVMLSDSCRMCDLPIASCQ